MKILKIIGWLSLLIALIGVICLASVSAMNLDNRKGELIKGEGISSYGKIEIKNFFGLGSTIATLELKKNSDYCLEDCSAEKEIVLTDEGILIDSVKFETITKDNKRIEQPIRSYQFYIKTGDKEIEVDDYKETCKEKLSLNGTMETLCTTAKSGTHTELEPIWTKYELGQVVPAGTYNVKLEGQKSPSKTVDWIVQSQGVWIDDWVVWYSTLGTGLVSYWNFDDSLRDSVGGFDFTNFGGEFIAGKNNNQLNFTTPDYAILTQNYSVGGNMNRTYNFWGKMPLQNCNANGYESICYFIASGDGIAKDWNIGIYHRFWYFEGGGAGMGGLSLILNDNLTHMHTVTYNGTGITWYLDNAIILALKINQPNTVVKNISLAYDFLGGTGYYGNVTIDELGIWNRTLTVAEISDLYNSGAGRFYESIILNTPANAYTSIYPSVSFNCTSFMMEGLTNMSFWLDGIKNETLVKTGTINESIFNKLIANGNHNWTCSSCDTDNVCIFAANRTLTVNTLGFIENSQSYNSSTYETASETFILNLTYNSIIVSSLLGTLWYNGTSYAGTKVGSGDTVLFTRTISVPIISTSGNKSFNWEIALNGAKSNSSTKSQIVNQTFLNLCNTTYKVPFVNFTFKDESTDGVIDAMVDTSTWTYWLGDGSVTKTLYFSNTTKSNLQYGFCFVPADKTLNIDLSFKYSNASYPQRTWTYDNKVLTNTTTMQVLYLLGSADGIYTSIQMLSSGGQPISGVIVTLERQFLGVWTLMEQGITDNSGLVTFWVNPNYDYRITASKTNYITQQVTIRPSQSTYTMRLSTTGGSSVYSGGTEGIRWTTRPTSGVIRIGTHSFNATVTSFAAIQLQGCRLDLLNMTNVSQTLATSTSAATNTTYCYVGFDYTLGRGTKLFGRLSIDTDQSTGYFIIDADSRWIDWDLNASSGNGTSWRPWNQMDSFFDEIKNLSEFGDDATTRDFSRLVFFFLIATIGIGVFTYFSGYELQSPGSGIFIIFCLVLFASASGFLTLDYSIGSGTSQTQWGFFFMFLFLTLAYGMDIIRRNR